MLRAVQDTPLKGNQHRLFGLPMQHWGVVLAIDAVVVLGILVSGSSPAGP